MGTDGVQNITDTSVGGGGGKCKALVTCRLSGKKVDTNSVRKHMKHFSIVASVFFLGGGGGVGVITVVDNPVGAPGCVKMGGWVGGAAPWEGARAA